MMEWTDIEKLAYNCYIEIQETNMEEIWKDIIGYEGLYQVSNLGNVKSLPRQWKHGV